MKISLKQLLVLIVLLSVSLGIGIAIRDSRWVDAALFAWALSAFLAIFALLYLPGRTPNPFVTRSKVVMIMIAAVILGAMAGLLWGISL